LDKMAERELAEDMSLEALRDAPLEPLVVPSESEFAAAVRQALRDFRRPDRLAASKLLRCRLVLGGAGGSTGAERLQSLILEAAKSLRGSPRDRKAFEAVLHTYLEPAPTQEAAAERVDMPFSTYRRYLAAGVERITAWLWERELHGSAAPEEPPGARRPN
jgi:hypothetical protein